MRTVWKVEEGNAKLLLFFSGWAMDENPTAHLKHEGMDLCVCFDYTNLEAEDGERWKSYSEVILIAWSTGVWAAEQVIGKLSLPISEAIAVNGTPTTVHDETGIPRAVFQGTYDNLSSQSMRKFQRRMMGSAVAYNTFIPFAPQRELEDQKKELANILSVNFDHLETGFINWNKAIIGTNDAIFPPENQLRYWSSCRRDAACRISTVKIIELPLSHYPFLDYTNFLMI